LLAHLGLLASICGRAAVSRKRAERRGRCLIYAQFYPDLPKYCAFLLGATNPPAYDFLNPLKW
jgi:hypothetical protein